MIYLHIDITDDGHLLNKAYQFLRNEDIVLINPTKKELAFILENRPKETLICLGHGSDRGLFGTSESYIIDESMVKYLTDREVIGIWCYAGDFFEKHNLTGFATSMWISDISECLYEGFKNHTSDDVLNEVTNFAIQLNELTCCRENLKDFKKLLVYDKTKDYLRFNYENANYFDKGFILND